MKWTETYAIGQTGVDEDHQKLFELFNRFRDSVGAGQSRETYTPFLLELADYSRYHFLREEALMRQRGYPDYDKHKQMHDSFCDLVQKLVATGSPTDDDIEFLMNYVEMWLYGHILVLDKWFGEWLDGRGGKAAGEAPIS
jgi:hemerythrin